MSILNIDKRDVSKLNRNKRINTSSSTGGSTSTTEGGTQYIFENGLELSGNTVTFSGEFTGNTTFIGDMHVEGNITASEDVIAYVAGAVTSDVLNALSVTEPLEKSGTNVELNYNTTQFELNASNELQIKSGVLTPSEHTHSISGVTGLQTALDSKATPTDISSAITSLVDSSPATLNTLNELANALGDDPNFATTVSNQIGLKAPINNPTFTGTVSGISKSMVGLGNVDNTSDANKSVSYAANAGNADTLDSYHSSAFFRSDSTSPSIVTSANFAIGTDATRNFIQSHSGKPLDLNPLGNAVTINNNTVYTTANLSKSSIGLGNVENTSDASKPVSTAQQTALNLKLDSSSYTASDVLSKIKTVDGSGSGLDADTLDGLNSTEFSRAYGAYSFGNNMNNITTADFVTMLTNIGAFNYRHFVVKGSWSYAGNQIITDTGCGNIHLAGATIEVINDGSTYTIKIITPTTVGGGSALASREFIYNNQGSGYSPAWRRIWTTYDFDPDSKVDKVTGKSLVNDTDIAKLVPLSVTSTKVTIDRDLHVEGNITASNDVVAYVAGAVSSSVLDSLTVSSPLTKTGTNISLDTSSFVRNNSDGYGSSISITQIITLSLAEYNSIGNKSNNVMYVII